MYICIYLFLFFFLLLVPPGRVFAAEAVTNGDLK